MSRSLLATRRIQHMERLRCSRLTPAPESDPVVRMLPCSRTLASLTSPDTYTRIYARGEDAAMLSPPAPYPYASICDGGETAPVLPQTCFVARTLRPSQNLRPW
jgi:hypothetical protein